jgi:hypothetical protein
MAAADLTQCLSGDVARGSCPAPTFAKWSVRTQSIRSTSGDICRAIAFTSAASLLT